MIMKQYSKPVTETHLLALSTFVCGVSSTNSSEQPSTSPQLAPAKGGDFIS